MVKPIIQIGNKLLNSTSERVPAEQLSDKQNQQLITDLLDTVTQDDLNSAGLSAVQIGVLKRICVVRLQPQESDRVEWEVMVNPEVTIVGTDQSTFWEGCLSIGVGESQLFGPVTRAKTVKVDYLSPTGDKRQLEATDYTAHIVQHEVDHLNGILFLSYIKNPKNIWRSDELDSYLQEHREYPPLA